MSSSWWNYFSKKTNKKNQLAFFFVRSLLINCLREIKLDFENSLTLVSIHSPAQKPRVGFSHSILPHQTTSSAGGGFLTVSQFISSSLNSLSHTCTPSTQTQTLLDETLRRTVTHSLLQLVANWSTNTTSYSQLLGRGVTPPPGQREPRFLLHFLIWVCLDNLLLNVK